MKAIRILLVIFIILFVVSGAISLPLFFRSFYYAQIDRLGIPESTGYTVEESKEAFEDALSDYPGTVITVTHDRYYLNKIPDRIFELTAEGIREYLGKYDYYLAKKESGESGKAYLKSMSEGTRPESVSERIEEDTRRKESENNIEALAGSKEERQLKKQKEAEERRRERESARLMSLISASEERICELEVEMMDPGIATDHEALSRLSKEMAELKEIVENAYDEWDKLV